MSNLLLQKKICMLGMFGVGKTSLTDRFVHNRFDDSYLSTIGVKVSRKRLPPAALSAGKMVQLSLLIWDIEGAETPGKVISNYFHGAAGALVVTDLTRPESMDVVPFMVHNFLKIAPGAKIVLVGNKADLLPDPSGMVTPLENLATDFDSPIFITSAKTGLNVEESFQQLGRLIIKEVK